jgi:pyruvate dehydrogenase phosphatase
MTSEASPALPRRHIAHEIPRLLPSCGGKWPSSNAAFEGHNLVNCYAGNLSIAVIQANNSFKEQYRVESSQPFGTVIGIFDGHGGSEAAQFACDNLFLHLQENLSSSQRVTTDAISKAFKATEEGFIELVSRQWKTDPQIATVGACCLVGAVQQKTLFIANLGNSRAVLGKISCTGQIVAEQLSSEHIANDAWKAKGLVQVLRAIGDAYLKHPQYSREPLNKPILGANPSIVSHVLRPSDRFIIFGSAVLWEYLSNQEAVEIVKNHQASVSFQLSIFSPSSCLYSASFKLFSFLMLSIMTKTSQFTKRLCCAYALQKSLRTVKRLRHIAIFEILIRLCAPPPPHTHTQKN